MPMTQDEVDAFRASEHERMKPMREAMCKEAFVQGWLRGKFGTLGDQSDEVMLAALPAADEAYASYRKHRTGP